MGDIIMRAVCGKKLSNKQAMAGCCGIEGNKPWFCPICKTGYEILKHAQRCRELCSEERL